MTPSILALCMMVTIGLALVLVLRARLTRSREGKVLAFVALVILPVVCAWGGFREHMELAQSRSFCLSCHVMADYGRSLTIDDPSYIPAVHMQNRLISREQACFTCHTTYTMFGDYQAKLRGVRHLYVQYLGTVPKPEAIKLYDPYNNRECLHCHLGARPFEEASAHLKTPALLDRVKSNQLSCTSSGCHEFVHDVGALKGMKFWKEGP